MRQIAKTLTQWVRIVCIDVDRQLELAVHCQVRLLPPWCCCRVAARSTASTARHLNP
ncbi:hypothetical protein [Streptomyces sp. NPDC005476]|uniref:hypothetical protein n=1 Tax=Streptomyces sp. NPDC005476 TaxID=3156882 RepID=UPI003455E3F0